MLGTGIDGVEVGVGEGVEADEVTMVPPNPTAANVVFSNSTPYRFAEVLEAREVHVSARQGEGRYEDRVVRSGRVESSAIEGFWLDADWLWKRPLPSGLESLKAILGVEKI